MNKLGKLYLTLAEQYFNSSSSLSGWQIKFDFPKSGELSN